MSSDTLLYAILGAFAVLTAAYVLGRSSARRTEQQHRRRMCSSLYDRALTQRESAPIEAALIAAEASAHVNRHECYHLTADVLEHTDRPSAAADYWSRARDAARHQSPGDQAYYYYRESRSFLRAKSFEFAYLRSKAAIDLIELGDIAPCAEGRDFLQHLRAVRMISSLHHLGGTEAWKAAMTDAVWLQSHATDPQLTELAASISAAHLAGEMVADMVGYVDGL